MSTFPKLSEKIANRTAVVGIVGLGYVGLPLVKTFTDAGFRVIGYDHDKPKIDTLLKGESYIEHTDLSWLHKSLAAEEFRPTWVPSSLTMADAIIMCVPTPVTKAKEPEMAFIRNTCEELAYVVNYGKLFVLESTTYPGTTRNVVLPLLNGSGMRAGKDYHLAYSPEREDPGSGRNTSKIPKVVGGIDDTSTDLACQLYAAAFEEVVRVANCEEAEACKIWENTYRAVNIAAVNEFKVICEKLGLDVWAIIKAAATKPFGFQPFYPGPGWGGHCIPCDPFYLSWLAKQHGVSARFIDLAGEINTQMHNRVVEKVAYALNRASKAVRGSKVGIIGLAYKKNVDDPRESPAFPIMEQLHERGAELSYHDPHIPSLPRMRDHFCPELQSMPLSAEWLSSLDCVVVVTDHDAVDFKQLCLYADLIVDSRNVMAAFPEFAFKVTPA